MSEQLPDGWAPASIADLVVDIEAGKSFKCDERPPTPEEIGVIKVSAVTWGEYREQESKTCTDSERVNPSLFVQPGDFLFSRANTIQLVGACVIVGATRQRIMLSDKILRLHFAHEEHKPWAMHFLRSNEGRKQIEALASGNQESMRNIGQARIGEICLPLPPFAEQARIIAKLEELLSDLDAGVAELKAAQKKLAQYRQSLLKAAVEGALTADWRAHNPPTETGAQLLQRILSERRARWEAKQLAKFKEQGKTPPKDWQKKYPEPVQPDTTGLPELPEGWVWASASMVGDILLGRQRAPQFLTGRYSRKYLRVANIRSDWIDFSDLAMMDFDETHFEKYRVQAGDILVSEGQSPDLVGQSAIFEEFAEDLCFQKTLHRFRADPFVTSHRFAQLVFRANVASGVFKRLASITTNIAHLTLEKFSASPFPLPPLGEQNAIVERADELFSGTKAVDTQVRDGLRIAAAQRQNILRAAFAGQLVPQDPNDEPASVLLERIRAGRQNAQAHGRRKSAVVRHSKEEIC